MKRYTTHISLALAIVILAVLLINLTAKTDYNGHFKSVQQFSNSQQEHSTKIKI